MGRAFFCGTTVAWAALSFIVCSVFCLIQFAPIYGTPGVTSESGE
jgi:hypothetical protein